MPKQRSEAEPVDDGQKRPGRSEARQGKIGRRAFRTIQQNLWFTAAYNVVGMFLAATGWLPPIVAAAAQSLPDVAVMLNSSRLLRTR